MRLRSFVAVVTAAVALVGAPAGADLSTDSGIKREVTIYFDDFQPTRHTSGYLTIYSHTGAASVGSTVTPRLENRAYGSYWWCDEEGCDGVGFDWQTVDPTALNFDPIGNSIQIDACLTPIGGGGCRVFDLTLSRPAGINAGYLCFPTLVCGVNAWHDPATGETSAGLATMPGVTRWGYSVSGQFGGVPFPTQLTGWMDATSWQRLVLDEQLVLP